MKRLSDKIIGAAAGIAMAMLINGLIFNFTDATDRPQAFATSKTDVRITEDLREADIQWFKDELKISEKYMEKHEGILGMSWLHFFVMVFLAVFGIGAMAIFIIKQKKMNEIMKLIRKELENGHES